MIRRDRELTQNCTQLQRVLGFSNYHRKLLKDFAIAAAPLKLLTSKCFSMDKSDRQFSQNAAMQAS